MTGDDGQRDATSRSTPWCPHEAGMTDVFEADAAFGDDSIILGLVPLKPESSLEDVVAQSTERFRDLAGRWPKIFPR